MISAVIDTNVLVSALINPDGSPAKILNMFLNRELTLLYDSRIIDEYREVLSRDKFAFPDDDINNLIEFILYDGIQIIPGPVDYEFSDIHDEKFFEAAVSGNADFLITGNKRHFPKRNFVVNAAEFLRTYKAGI
jgi:uncharacterized protein